MNNSYEQFEIIRGKQYRYDPDFDAYFRVQTVEGPVSKWAWVAVIVCMGLIAYYIEYLQ